MFRPAAVNYLGQEYKPPISRSAHVTKGTVWKIIWACDFRLLKESRNTSHESRSTLVSFAVIVRIQALSSKPSSFFLHIVNARRQKLYSRGRSSPTLLFSFYKNIFYKTEYRCWNLQKFKNILRINPKAEILKRISFCVLKICKYNTLNVFI